MTLHTRSDTAFGLISHDVAYHLLCDQGTSLPLSPSVPRACFETRWYIASSLSNPIPAKMDGFIDGSGKRFMLEPDAVVTLKNYEIHVNHQKEKAIKEQDQSCVDVVVYLLPERESTVRESWCPGQSHPIVL